MAGDEAAQQQAMAAWGAWFGTIGEPSSTRAHLSVRRSRSAADGSVSAEAPQR